MLGYKYMRGTEAFDMFLPRKISLTVKTREESNNLNYEYKTRAAGGREVSLNFLGKQSAPPLLESAHLLAFIAGFFNSLKAGPLSLSVLNHSHESGAKEYVINESVEGLMLPSSHLSSSSFIRGLR